MQSSAGLPFAARFFCFCLFTCAVVVSRFLLRDILYGSGFFVFFECFRRANANEDGGRAFSGSLRRLTLVAPSLSCIRKAS